MQAEIIADSKHYQTKDRLTTFEIEIPRVILPQLLTHRAFSRNTQSNRAVPIEKTIEQVIDNPYVPDFRSNKAGMQPGETLAMEDQHKCKLIWIQAMNAAIESARKLAGPGVHKQWANRLLEPYQYIKVIVTSSRPGLDNFFELRAHEDAQDEINGLANLMYSALKESTPSVLIEGETHSPYHPDTNTSAGFCAQISYRKKDADKAGALADKIYLAGHLSPFEHQAFAMNIDDSGVVQDLNGNLAIGWGQQRKVMEYLEWM